jgi:hypothetical protein
MAEEDCRAYANTVKIFDAPVGYFDRNPKGHGSFGRQLRRISWQYGRISSEFLLPADQNSARRDSIHFVNEA